MTKKKEDPNINTNMVIWNKVKKADPAYIKKDIDNKNKGLASISAQYMFMLATEQFGPLGVGWGYDILEERYDSAGFIAGEGSLDPVELKNHTIKIKFWFVRGKDKGEIVNYGHTKYIMRTNWGFMCDEEAPKKSLSDAIKKCLSMLGFCSDVYLGHFDDENYYADALHESLIEKDDERDKEVLERIAKHKAWIERELKNYELLSNVEALQKMNQGHIRQCDRRNDMDGVKIFEKALADRLEQLKGKGE